MEVKKTKLGSIRFVHRLHFYSLLPLLFLFLCSWKPPPCVVNRAWLKREREGLSLHGDAWDRRSLGSSLPLWIFLPWSNQLVTCQSHKAGIWWQACLSVPWGSKEMHISLSTGVANVLPLWAAWWCGTSVGSGLSMLGSNGCSKKAWLELLVRKAASCVGPWLVTYVNHQCIRQRLNTNPFSVLEDLNSICISLK